MNEVKQQRENSSGGNVRPRVHFEPLVIREQGSFAVGGTVISHSGQYTPATEGPEGQTLHGDHAHVFYQIPDASRKFPLVFLHGGGQFSKTWQSTPDGREGFQTIFLRRNFPVYLVDQPRRAGAGRSTEPASIVPAPDEQLRFESFRIGAWPEYYPGVLTCPGSLDQS